MLPLNNFDIRPMTRSELDLAVNWAVKEDWNPGLFDAECFYRTDPAGFLIGTLDNEPIGCISAVFYGHRFGFIGFYIVIPEFRGQGFGIQLWHSAMERLAGRNAGLDGVIAQEPNYVKAGFRRAYRNIRYELISAGTTEPERTEIVKLQGIPFETIVQYDRQCFFTERAQFLRYWLDMPSSFAVGYIEDNLLKGYGVIRRCYQGYKVGPLFADNQEMADKLYLHLVSKIEAGTPVYLDIPEANPAALALVKKYRMKEVFATARMYTQEQPDLLIKKIFGVTSFELG